MAGTSFSTLAKSATNISLTDQNGYGLFGDCVGAPDTTAGLYQHGCLMIRNDTSTGTPATYQNTGSIASPVWTLLDTALPGDTASSLVDTNNVVVVALTTVASTVNGLLITGSATGVVSANAVTIAPGAPSGSDAAISLQISPKGATGLLTIGLATGTGTITVGSSSAAQTLVLGGGAGISTVQIAGGSAANVVTIANVQTAGSVAMGAGMTTGTITLGGVAMTGAITIGATTTGTTAAVDILSANGTASTQTITIGGGTSTTSGGKVVNIANGVPGASTTNTVNIGAGGTTTGTVAVTIGSVGNAAHTTLIQGGSGAAITLTPQTTGAILIGAAAGTGTITLGSSSTTQTVVVGGGAGVATINIGTGAAANKITLGAAASLISLFGTIKNPKAANYVAAGGSNNAITATLTDASGTNIPLAAGLELYIADGALTLQAGANTLDFNGGGAVAIKKASAPTVDLAVARAANAIIHVIYNGTSWLEMSE